MKNIKKLLFFVLTLYSLNAFSQKGSFYIGGSGGFSSRTFSKSDIKSTSWNFSPEVGTFLTDNVQVGIGVKLKGTKSINVSDFQQSKYDYTETATGASIYGRYFFKPGSSFRPFVGLNVDILPEKQKYDFADNSKNIESKVFNLGANLNAGFSYAIAPRWSVLGSFATLGFNRSKPKNSDNVTTDFGLDINTLGNRFTIGFYYSF